MVNFYSLPKFSQYNVGSKLFFYVLICLLQDQIFANDVLGCNGFVKSNVGDIDFTKVEVKLFTKQGSLKDQTECAPNNGYYFLPLYDKGEYILKVSPPVGWHFEPSEVTVNVDGTLDSCSLGIDINFVLQGFAVTGQVKSVDEAAGPKGVQVKLLTATPSPEVLLSTTTNEGGNFILTPVKPGQYIIEGSHVRWVFNKKQTTVTVESGNTEIPANSLVVAGYDVSGKVTSDNEPIMGVSFVLFQHVNSKRISATGCDSSALSGFTATSLDLKQLVPVCHVASDAKGLFTFPSLPSGAYTVVPHYKGMHSIKFDVHPPHLAFKVKHDSLQLATTFQVKGFSVDGRVLWSSKGKPLEGAIVMLDQKEVSRTGSDGTFHLDSMTPGIYKLLIRAQNVQFEEQSVRVTPNTPHIGDIVPSAYRLSGSVSTSHPGSSAADRPVEFLLQEASQEVVHETSTDTAGHYSIFLAPGTYTVGLPVSEAEAHAGLQFAPLKKVVKVVDSPVTGVDFSQLRATVKGSIKCLSTPCPELAVTLQAHDSTTVLAKGGSYVFESVLPGEYSVTVSSEDWCWQTEKATLSVSSEHVEGPTFLQTGVPIHFVSSHATGVKYKLEGNTSRAEGVLEVAAGKSKVCVALPGVYVLEPRGCHGYSSPTVRWTGGLVTLTAVSHLYTGRVLSSEPVPDLVVNVIPSEENGQPPRVRRSEVVRAKREGAQYTFSTQLAVGETVTLVPAASSMLFSPMVAEVVGADHCVEGEEGVLFRAERGHVVEGRVMGNNVPVPGASVAIYNTQGQLIATQVTDSEGRYMFGPLSANTKYNVTAEKEGYVLTGPNDKGEFNAHKLAEVIVTVKDKADGQALQGVLLSLSGGENYRRISHTDVDGSLAFLSLSPSDYYLRPMMKEYKFDPASKMITVKEGATVEVTLSGERVAFSVWGSVTSLSGDPEPGVVVEAVGLGPTQCSQLQEESTTETTGQFRIRGLQPQCEYSVRVKQGLQVNQHIQRSTPEGIVVKVTKEDLQGLNIIVFRPISRTDVTVYVVTESPDHLRSLRVKMFRDDTTIHTVRLSSLKPTPTYALKSTALVFPPVPADGRTYSIQLESSLSQKTHNYRTHPVYFRANSSFQLVRLNFVTTARAGDSELSHTSYLTLPLLLVALLVFYNREAAKSLVGQLVVSRLASADSGPHPHPQEDSSGDTLLVEQLSTKKKIRQRKT